MSIDTTSKIHLICNAHLDPVWLWEWEEGAAEAISTFRAAADLCEQFDGFIFNHNEALLYKWIEEYEPDLFDRIRTLVKKGRWHIMGGWYLQPDCNMPSGESFVRQVLTGRLYFKEKFGVEPTTAVNFDPFGHTRGLVQILKKAGFDSYIFCRPSQKDCTLPADEFEWVGYDKSTIQCCRASDHYSSAPGEADKKVKKWLKENSDRETGIVLWGVGNHGGGPSRKDISMINQLKDRTKTHLINHSTPESYFADLRKNKKPLPQYEGDLNPWAVGCYTSQARIKKRHRMLENEIYMTEKMMSCASMQGYLEYPRGDIHNAVCNLMFSEFHDILPGTSIQAVEESSLRCLDAGLETMSRLKARAFFALAGGQEKAQEGTIPILAYNPHPYQVKRIFECEFQLASQNPGNEFTLPVVHYRGKALDCQTEQEICNHNIEWRKRVVFIAELPPSLMSRFDCKLNVLPEKPGITMKARKKMILFKSGYIEAAINTQTGLMDTYRVRGIDFLLKDSFCPIVMDDNDDSWGMKVKSFRDAAGRFSLMDKEKGTRFSGITENILDSVRVIEDGDVRTVVEAVFSYKNSFICTRYKLPRKGTEIEVEVRVYWNEKSKMLKLSLPCAFPGARYIGQTAYGTAELPANGREAAAQKWVAVVSEKDDCALTCINDGTYGSDFCQGELRLSLLRSPGYSAHPIYDRTIMPQDRFSPRLDQGEHLFNFWINAGRYDERIQAIDREALAHNEKPMILSFFPSGEGNKPLAFVELRDSALQMTAFKKAETENAYIIRVFNPLNHPQASELALPFWNLVRDIRLGAFEIKTFKADIKKKKISETNLMENQ